MINQLPPVSEALYVGLYNEIGTPTEVNIRREVTDMKDTVTTSVENIYMARKMNSGSCREGFRLKSSDYDSMFWTRRVKLIFNLSNFNDSDAFRMHVLLMEHLDTYPGFVILKRLTQTRNKMLLYSTVTHQNDLYISSVKFRILTHDLLVTLPIFVDSAKLHGPCSKLYDDNTEQDFAHCFFCQYWPQTALVWIERCRQNGWPVQNIINKIISNGCHVMPVGSKSNCIENELEWRLSFLKQNKTWFMQ